MSGAPGGHGLLGRRGRGRAELDMLARAAARLEPLDLYPRPLDTTRVRILHVPWLSYVWQGYARNEHELEARRAVAATR